MKEHLHETLELTQKNLELCPWIRSRDFHAYAAELFDEVEELKAAIANHDTENIKEEIGDVVWDAIVLAHIAQREGLFDAAEVIKELNNKIKRRKPFLLTDEKLTLDQVRELWHEAKRQEKLAANNDRKHHGQQRETPSSSDSQ